MQIYSPSLYLSFNSINKVLGRTAEVFNFKKFNLPAIPFIHHDFSVASKTSSPKPRSSMFSPMLFSRNFTIVYVLHLCMWFIHFKLIFVKGIRSLCLDLLCLHVNIQFQHHLLKRLLSFLHWITLVSLSNISWLYLYVAISGLSILFSWSVCSFSSITLFWLL